MKKFLAIVTILITHYSLFICIVEPDNLSGQTLGFNCEGLPDNIDAQTTAWLNQLGQPPVMRLTGAAIKFYHYAVGTNGAGMDSLQIAQTFDTLGTDENGEGLENVLDQWRVDRVKTTSDLVTFANAAVSTNSPVIWVANVFNGTPSETLAQLAYLFGRGINVVGIEMGNECYAWYDDNFSWYQYNFEPHLNAVRAAYPSLLISLVSGQLNRSDRIAWNNALEAYIDAHPAYNLRFTIHRYLDQATCSDFNSISEYIITPTFNTSLNTLFISTAACMLASDLILDEVIAAKAKYGRPCWVTEYNTKPYVKVVNSIVNGAWIFKQFFELKAQCEYVTVHNGVSSSLGGLINRDNKFDLNPDEQDHFRRTGYWSLWMATKYPSAVEYTGQTAPGVYWYHNITASAITVPNSNTICLKGISAYSSAGYTGYMANGTTTSMELDTVDYVNNTLPAYSYGIVICNCGQSLFYQDYDNDTYGNLFMPVSACEKPVGYVTNNSDCNDMMNAVHPGANEICNDMDDNCNGSLDDGVFFYAYYPDADNDSYGDKFKVYTLSCKDLMTGFVKNNTDCNDANAAIHPGAAESCGTIDNNCDGKTIACPPVIFKCKAERTILKFLPCKNINTINILDCDCRK